MLSTRRERIILIAMLTLGFFAHFLGWFTRSAEFNDGAAFIFSTLDQARGGLLYINDRLTGRIIQAPAALALRIFGFHSAYRFAFEYLHSVYLFIPLVGLVITIALLIRGKREDLIPFPVLSYGLVTLGSIHFAMTTLQETTTAFWILFGLVAGREESFGKRRLFLIALSSVFLGLGYEPVIVLFPMVMWICWRRREAFWLCGLGLIPLLIRYWRITSDGLFMKAMQSSLHAPHFQFVVMTIVLLIALALLTHFKVRPRWAVAIALLELGNALFWLHRSWESPAGASLHAIWDSDHMRAPALPLVAVLATIAVWYHERGRKEAEIQRQPDSSASSLFVITVVSLVVGVLFNVSATLAWQNSRSFLLNFLKSVGPGCHVVPSRDLDGAKGISGLFIPYMTLLMQDPATVDRIVFSDDPESRRFQSNTPCAQDPRVPWAKPEGLVLMPGKGNYDFTEIMARLSVGTQAIAPH